MARHWHRGDKSLAAIHLARMGLPDIGEDAAYRLSLAAQLIGAGVAPRELARDLEFDPAAGLVKYNYNPNEARVPAGSGDWTNGNATGSPLTEGRSAGLGKPNHVPGNEHYKTIKDLPRGELDLENRTGRQGVFRRVTEGYEMTTRRRLRCVWPLRHGAATSRRGRSRVA